MLENVPSVPSSPCSQSTQEDAVHYHQFLHTFLSPVFPFSKHEDVLQQKYEACDDCKRSDGFEEVPCRIDAVFSVGLFSRYVLYPCKNLLCSEENENPEGNRNHVDCQCVPMGLVLSGHSGERPVPLPYEGAEDDNEHQ